MYLAPGEMCTNCTRSLDIFLNTLSFLKFNTTYLKQPPLEQDVIVRLFIFLIKYAHI